MEANCSESVMGKRAGTVLADRINVPCTQEASRVVTIITPNIDKTLPAVTKHNPDFKDKKNLKLNNLPCQATQLVSCKTRIRTQTI